jgi:hypothetical protein
LDAMRRQSAASHPKFEDEGPVREVSAG